MLKGINGVPYFNLESHLDMPKWDSLRPEVARGIALAREHAREGNWIKQNFDINLSSYTYWWKPICNAIEEFLALPDTDLIKQTGWDLWLDAKDRTTWDSDSTQARNKFVRYLKASMGANDPYLLYHFDNPVMSEFFPNTNKWIYEELVGEVFTYVTYSLLMLVEHDCIQFEHLDDYNADESYLHGLDNVRNVSTQQEAHRDEFVLLRHSQHRPWYLWDPQARVKTYTQGRALWFNGKDWHGGERSNEQTYTLRVSGCFTDKFREQLGINHLDSY
jgi:hypothetical protein